MNDFTLRPHPRFAGVDGPLVLLILDGVGLYRGRSRLQAIARANSLVCIPEGVESLSAGDTVPVQILAPRLEGV